MHSELEFLPGTRLAGKIENALAFVVNGKQLLMKNGAQGLRVPLCSELTLTAQMHLHALGSLDRQHCIAWEQNDFADGLPAGMEWCDLYRLLLEMDAGTLAAAGAAVQIVDWEKNHRYCGRCAEPTQSEEKNGERRRVCRSCQLDFYPRLSPCVIVLVHRGRELLLAHGARHPPGMYSPLAGFVEPGENIEQTVRREVLEEVGVHLGALHYFHSQPWPFPHQLMLGFFAEYKSGELIPDGTEILDAGWYPFDQLPEIPGTYSISGALIREAARELQSEIS